MYIIDLMNQFRALPGALVDVNIGQGKDAVWQHMHRHRPDFMPADIIAVQESIAELATLVAPYQLPDDYLFFLEYYGGAVIRTDRVNLEILGLGPMTLEWYEFVVALNAIIPPPRTSLHIGDVSWVAADGPEESPPSVTFLLDVAGVVQSYSMIGLGPDDAEQPAPFLTYPEDRRAWQIVAPTFAAWLDLAVATKGTFGYW